MVNTQTVALCLYIIGSLCFLCGSVILITKELAR